MRDEHGRYSNLKELTDNGPTWVKGCDVCSFGIVNAPELTGAVPVYLERVVQAADGNITFCKCQAGEAYRNALASRWKEMQAQTKSDANIRTHKTAGSEEPLNPLNMLRIDGLIEIARNTIYAALAKNKPTIHA